MTSQQFYDIWKGSISKRWRTLGKDMAQIAWNQRHSELSSIPENVCKDACEKLVMEPDRKYAPSLGTVINRILQESNPKAKSPAFKEENGLPANLAFARDINSWCKARVGESYARRLIILDGLEVIQRRHNIPIPDDQYIWIANQKRIIEGLMGVEPPKKKAQQQHEKKLTHVERVALARKRYALKKSTVGNALRGALR